MHQHLVALAVAVQLARHVVDSDPEAAKAQLDELGRDLEHALQETALLAQRLYPATLESGQLAALLRAAAVNAGVPASVDVAIYSNYPPELAMTIYLCWVETLARANGETRVSIGVREDEDALAFEVTAVRPEQELERVRDRVEALGGRLTVTSTGLAGSLPLAR